MIRNGTVHEQTTPDDELAATVDWRTKGAVTPVKDQVMISLIVIYMHPLQEKKRDISSS